MYVRASYSLHKGTWWKWRGSHWALGSGTQPLPDHKVISLARAVSARRKGSLLQIHLLSQEPAHSSPLFLLRHGEGQAVALGELGDCL